MTKTRDLADLGGGFIQAGTGAVQRTVELKLQDVISVKDFGAVGDGVADDTAAIQAAINAAGDKSVFLPSGNYRTTGTLYPLTNTKLVGEPGASGAFISFVTKITYDPPAAITSTLSANISGTDLVIPVNNASSFPASGIVYLQSVNGEYIKYTGKSGNTLTGCTRSYWGGTEFGAGITPEPSGGTYPSGTKVSLLRPALMRDSTFSGIIKDIAIYRSGFTSADVGWADLGLCFYFNYAAYGTILQDTLIYGFEKAGYCGRAYVTHLRHPMVYSCYFGIQMDSPNGSVVSESDFGDIGSATLSQIGWCYYFRGGEGCHVNGGSLGNGNYNVPIYSDGCKPVKVTGIYVEAHKIELCVARRGGIIFMNGVFSKESTFRFGTVEDGGKIFIENLYHVLSGAAPYIFNTDNTGSWSIKNSFNGTTNSYDLDQYGIGTKRYAVPHFTQSTSPLLNAEQRGVKAIPDNTATSIFKIRTTTSGAKQDQVVGLTVDYLLSGDWNGGSVSQKGILEVVINHRWTLNPVATVTKVGETVATSAGTTRTTTFTANVVFISGNTFETIIQVTSVASSGAPSTLSYVVKPSNANLVSSTDDGLLTIL